MKPPEDKSSPTLIPPHGGCPDLKSFQMAELVFDCTVVFCDRFIDRRARKQSRLRLHLGSNACPADETGDPISGAREEVSSYRLILV